VARLGLDLAAEAEGAGPPIEAEIARRAALRDLPMPAAGVHPGLLPGSFRLGGEDIAGASLAIGRFLFARTGYFRWGGFALALLAAAAAALGAARRVGSGRPFRAEVAIMAIAITVGMAAAVLAPPDPGLVIVNMPDAARTGRMSGEFRARREMISGVGILDYSIGGVKGKTGLAMAGIIAPRGRSLPLGLIEAPGTSGCRFSAPPLVITSGGEFRIETREPIRAWLLDGE
jgi:hypothetical protein